MKKIWFACMLVFLVGCSTCPPKMEWSSENKACLCSQQYPLLQKGQCMSFGDWLGAGATITSCNGLQSLAAKRACARVFAQTVKDCENLVGDETIADCKSFIKQKDEQVV